MGVPKEDDRAEWQQDSEKPEQGRLDANQAAERRLADYRSESSDAKRVWESELPNVGGFERSELVTDSDVEGYLNQEFPPEHVHDIEHLLYTGEYREFQDPHRGTMVELGSFDPARDTVSINRQDQIDSGLSDLGKLHRTLDHEVGHHVYHEYLDHEHKETWQVLSQMSKRGPNGEYVTEYAETNPREDFAESYWAYARAPEDLRDASPAKYEFMRTVVFHEEMV